MKPEGVTIQQIAAASSSNASGAATISVLGLGSDQNVYLWRIETRTWDQYLPD